MTVTCASCNLPCLRADCHRNRYNELICRACHADGVRFTWRNRIRHHLRMANIGFWILLGCTSLVLLFAWAIYMLTLVPPAWISNG